jgi:amino acid transporter
MQATDFSSFSPGSAALLLLFVGSSFPLHKEDSMIPLVVPILVAAVGLLLYSLWAAVSLEFVTPERLASSTIPHMTAARKILGETGRQVMGIVVISGTCGAINGLFLICRRVLAALPDPKKKSGLLTPAKQRWLLPPLFAVSTAIMMATGLAGDEFLEVLLRAALDLWLLYYCMLCLAAALWLKRTTGKLPLTGLLSALLLACGIGLAVMADEQRLQLILSMAAILIASALPVSCWSLINNFFATKPIP